MRLKSSSRSGLQSPESSTGARGSASKFTCRAVGWRLQGLSTWAFPGVLTVLQLAPPELDNHSFF